MSRLPRPTHSAIYILYFSFFISLPSLAQPPDRVELIRYAAESGERAWRRASAADTPDNLSSRELFTYALALCEAGLHPERLERLFGVARQMQDRDPQSRGYGNFRWRWGEDRVRDFNAVDFCMQAGSLLWLRHRDTMPAGARDVLSDILDHAVEGSLRHRVPENYTNIALMNAGNLILLGEALDRPGVAEEGYRRLDWAVRYTWEYGTHEYCSPTYYGVDLDDLLLIERFCRQARGRARARALLALIWTDIALNWFPPAQKLAGAQSRTYDYIRGLGHLDVNLWAAGWLPGRRRGGVGAIYPALGRWLPPDSLRSVSATRFPRLVRQSWGMAAAESRTHYLLEDVTLGSAGSNYNAMDMPLTVDLPGDRRSPRAYFIPDARHDPYGKVKISAGNHQKAQHLRPFWRAAQQKRDALGIAIYRNRDLPEASETLESHVVFPRDVDGIWVGVKKAELDSGRSLPLPPGSALVFRKGTAAVGIRVPWSQGQNGNPAPAALVNDGNPYGALRLTVSHHTSDKQTVAGAALWVRIGGGIVDDAAFAAWQHDFAQSAADVTADGNGVRVQVQGSDGPVVVRVSAPYRGGGNLLPAPSKAVIELDGEDIGRNILSHIKPMALSQPDTAVAPVAVSATHGVYWDAEDGAVAAPMVIHQDRNASNGACVWMPGASGSVGGSVLGRVTWRLRVPRAGTYYVWGRVLAPTPQDDSFHVRAFTARADLVDLAEWHTGTHETWEWTRLTLDRSETPTPFHLPRGESRLQLRVREDGTKIDRLYITPDAEDTPEDE